MAKFTVDTHLFRELGELLVGRDSTALVELIKNAYDADATQVTVEGRFLDNPGAGYIIIRDNGVGMTPEQFENGFLRIASRQKEGGSRTSLMFKRRYTGAKGIGRLAAHKIARLMRIYSVSRQNGPTPTAIDATIDWDLVEAQQTLDEIEATRAIQQTAQELGSQVETGTTIELHRLRRRWREEEKTRFFAEVQSFKPPEVLLRIPPSVVAFPLLFDEPVIRSASAKDTRWDIDLSGELDAGEDYWQVLSEAAQWIIEIDARRGDRRVEFNIVPTKSGQKAFPGAVQKTYNDDHPTPLIGPFFQSRILVREGAVRGRKLERAWFSRSYGIRVYMEGFRVLPYGEPNNDWLWIDADYKKRAKTLTYLDIDFAGEPADKNEALVSLGNSSYFGAVFLTADQAQNLQMLVNREGFISDAAFQSIVNIMKKAVGLCTRVRAAAKAPVRAERKKQRAEKFKDAELSKLALKEQVERSVTRATKLAKEARILAATGDYEQAEIRMAEAAAEITSGSQLAERFITEGALLRVLASVGMQMAAFVHEIRSLLATSQAIEAAVSKLRDSKQIQPDVRKDISRVLSIIGDLRRAVERQASYLVDIASPDALRRRSRQNLRDSFEIGRKVVETSALKRNIAIENQIPPSLKSPPMFPAEVTLVFSNLLTNAIKAAGKGGSILARGITDTECTKLTIENTGVRVDLADAEGLFAPFESTTVEADPVLGQGMGMGLPITRNILEEYGAEIHFVAPSHGYATAVRILLPK